MIIGKEQMNMLKTKKKSDLNFKLPCNFRSGTSSTFKSHNVRKTNKTIDFLGFTHSFFKSWLIHQLYGNMTIENYGKIWCSDHCLAVASFNLLSEKEMKNVLFGLF